MPKEPEETKEFLRRFYPEVYLESKTYTDKKPYARLVVKE